MADISQEMDIIENAAYGEQVRTAIIDAATAINDDMNAIENTNKFLEDDTYHGCYFRGKSLGTGATFEAASTAEQRAAIADGTFDDMFVGDYWTINNKVFRIADFNYFKTIGDTSFATNHLVIVPDNALLNAVMNDENITTGAYIGSKMYSDPAGGLAQAKSIIDGLFGTYMASHRIYLPNAVSADGAESAGAWVDSTVDLLSEVMVYGCKIKSKANAGTFIATSEKSQLALFRLNPLMVNVRITYWLRDVVSSTLFAYVGSYGSAANYGASYSYGVRPFFTIKGTK